MKVDADQYSILGRKDHVSFRLTEDKINQFKDISTIYPMVFFILSMLVMAISIIRLVEKQKYEIGIMQALGIKQKTIKSNYCLIVVVISLPGTILGYVIGEKLLPAYIFKSMYMYQIPSLFGLQPKKNLVVVLFAIICCVLAVMFALSRCLKDNIVSNLKGDKDNKFKKISLEDKNIWEKLSFSTKWVIKDIRTHAIKSFTVFFAMTAAMIIMTSALDQRDCFNDIIPWYFKEINIKAKLYFQMIEQILI